jgi:hypothetical protein
VTSNVLARARWVGKYVFNKFMVTEYTKRLENIKLFLTYFEKNAY